MSNEIDRLEIVVEAEAKRANRALSGMEKRLNRIADGLEKVASLSSAMDNFGNLDLKGFEKVRNEIDSIMKSVNGLGRKSASPKIDRSDIKYAAKSLDDLYDKFKDVGKNMDLSGKGLPELRRGLKDAESAASRLNERLDKKISLEGTDRLGKSWESLIYDIQKATNQAEIYREEISRISKEVPKLKINRGQTSYSSDASPKVGQVSSESLGYNPDAMRAVFGEGAEGLKNFDDVMKKFGGNAASAAKSINDFEGEMNTQKINTYESKIRKLKADLAEISSKGFAQGDAEYDSIYKQIVQLEQALKRYKKEMRDSVSTGSSSSRQSKRFREVKSYVDSAYKSIKRMGSGTLSAMKKAGKGIASFAKNARDLSKALASPIAQLGRLKNAIFGVQKQTNKGMSWGRMIGSSVLFSFVFQGISMIQRAIKEGSDNLVQYSSAYNNSISGIVSSLTYLKNAWAAAFAPIVNVVAPYLQAFVDMVANALNMVGQFFAALTGKGFAVQAKKVWQDYGSSISNTGGSADKTNSKLKELKKTILGFDQLNMLNDNSDPGGGGSGGAGGSGGGGGILPSDMFETIETQGAVAEFAKRLRKAFLNEDWEELGKILADGVNTGLEYLYDAISWNKVGPKITHFANAFTTTFNSLVDNIDWDLMGRTVGAGINTIVNTANLFMEGIDWTNLGRKFAVGLNGAFKEINWVNLGKSIGNYFMISWKTFYGFLGELDFDEIGRSFGQSLNGAFSRIDFTIIGGTIARGLTGIADFVIEFFNTVDWNQFALNFSNGLNTLIKETDWEAVGTAINDAFINILSTLSTIAKEVDWEEFGKSIGEMLSQIDWYGVFKETATIIKEVIGGMFDGLSQTVGGKVVLLMTFLGLAFKGGSVLLSVAEFIAGVKSKFSTLQSIFGNATKQAQDATKGLGDSTNEAGGFLSNFAGKLKEMASKSALGAGWLTMTKGAVDQLQVTADEADYTILKTALRDMGDSGVLAKDKMNDLYGTLCAASEKKVPFEDAMAYVRDELKQSGISAEEFEKSLSTTLDDLGVSAPEQANFIGKGIGDGTKKGLEESKKKVEDATKGIAHTIINKFKELLGIHSPSTVFAQFARYCGEGFSNNLDSAFSSALNFFRRLPGKIENAIGSLWNLGRNVINGFVDGFTSIHIPTPHFKVTGHFSIAGIKTPIPKIGVSWYAKGGFPAMGEMFIANEKGPEMVGRMGRKNVVANNNQITSGIKAAVIEGMMEVFMATGGMNSGSSQPQTLYIEVKTENDEVLARAVKRGNEKLDYRHNPSPAY